MNGVWLCYEAPGSSGLCGTPEGRQSVQSRGVVSPVKPAHEEGKKTRRLDNCDLVRLNTIGCEIDVKSVLG